MDERNARGDAQVEGEGYEGAGEEVSENSGGMNWAWFLVDFQGSKDGGTFLYWTVKLAGGLVKAVGSWRGWRASTCWDR